VENERLVERHRGEQDGSPRPRGERPDPAGAGTPERRGFHRERVGRKDRGRGEQGRLEVGREVVLLVEVDETPAGEGQVQRDEGRLDGRDGS
jgi:hypothetical protein